MPTRRTGGPRGLRGLRLEDLERGRVTERRIGGRDEAMGRVDVGSGERPCGAAELHQGPARIVGVDRGAPAVVDRDHVMALVEEALAARGEVVEACGRER